MFQRIGAAAMKPDLGNIERLCKALGNPQEKFPSIHIAGTNGKGSSSHMLAAVFQSAGYQTGLYTSPHLKDFRERIRVNGKPIDPQDVVDFVLSNQQLFDAIKPSFFELTVALAFEYFASTKVDIAIIEVGLGGRLDSTNIIHPEICLITNIGYDHSDLLGNSLQAIAREKAGIIKAQVPVVIGERQPEIEDVFRQVAVTIGADLYYADEAYQITSQEKGLSVYQHGKETLKNLVLDLNGPFQLRNLPGVLKTLAIAKDLGFSITDDQLRQGMAGVVGLTGIKGRWQTLYEQPKVICDTGHNTAALKVTVAELGRLCEGVLHMVLGFVNDKDINGMLEVLPKQAHYYFCSATVPRSMDAQELATMAKSFGLIGRSISDPNEALAAARKQASPNDLIFIGGSTFVVAELVELDK